jgi:hypothetical protein
MRPKVLLMVAAVICAGCGHGASLAPASSPAQPAQTGITCHPEWPIVAHRAGGDVVNLPAGAALPTPCVTQTGFASSESTIAVGKTGTLIYSPADTENTLARSSDGGMSWQLTSPADEQRTSFWNTVDPYVIADRKTGWMFWTHATGPIRNEGGLPQGSGFYLAAAYGFQVYTSSDDGESWSTADYQTAPTGDWEQVFVGPPPPVTSGAAQPVAYPDIVYFCANAPVEVSGPGRACYKSLDGGGTFSLIGFASPTASNPQDICPPLQFRNGVVDTAGTIYLAATCQFSDYVLVSQDEGVTWTWLPVKDAPTSSSIITGGWLQIAMDDADTLYALWPGVNDGLLYLEISHDHAMTWSKPMMVAMPGLHQVQRPAFKAGAPGHVGIAYYASTDPGAFMVSGYITQTEDALDPDPLFYSAAINDPAVPIYHDYGLASDSPRIDFIGGSYDGAGTTFWGGIVKQFGPPDANGDIVTSGYVARLSFAPSTPERLP